MSGSPATTAVPAPLLIGSSSTAGLHIAPFGMTHASAPAPAVAAPAAPPTSPPHRTEQPPHRTEQFVAPGRAAARQWLVPALVVLVVLLFGGRFRAGRNR